MKTNLPPLFMNSVSRFDPLANFLSRFSDRSAVRLAYLVYGGFCTVLGVLLSIYYEMNHKPILLIYDIREAVYAVIVYLVGLPLVTYFYARESQSISQLYNSLASKQVIKMTPLDLENYFANKLSAYNKIYIAIIPYIGALVISVVWINQATRSTNDFYFGKTDTWWHANPYFFWIIFVPFVMFVGIYMGFWIIIRRFIATRAISQLMETQGIEPKLLDDDGCSGLGSIGNYVTQISILIMVVGLWMVAAVIYPTFYGEALNLKYDTILFIILYSFLVPAILFGGTRATHRRMLLAKKERLSEWALKIQGLLRQLSEREYLAEDSSQELNNRQFQILMSISSAEATYRLIEKEQRTWPINFDRVRRYLLQTGWPFLLGVFEVITSISQFAAQLISKQLFH